MALPELLAAAAAAFYAGSSVLIRKGLQDSHPDTAVVMSLAANAALLIAAALLFVPLSYFASFHALLIFAAAGILAPGLARMLRYRSFERIGITKTGPITAMSPLISMSLAILFLEEAVTLPVLLGTALIIAGVAVSSRKGRIGRTDALFAFGVALLTGASAPLRKYGLTLIDSPILVGAVTAIVALIVALLIVSATGGIRNVKFSDKGIPLYAAAGLLTSIAFLLNFTALAQGSVVTISPIIQTTPIFALLLSKLFIEHLEDLSKEVWIGTALVVAGAFLIGSS